MWVRLDPYTFLPAARHFELSLTSLNAASYILHQGMNQKRRD
jgi:hypothetical protein